MFEDKLVFGDNYLFIINNSHAHFVWSHFNCRLLTLLKKAVYASLFTSISAQLCAWMDMCTAEQGHFCLFIDQSVMCTNDRPRQKVKRWMRLQLSFLLLCFPALALHCLTYSHTACIFSTFQPNIALHCYNYCSSKYSHCSLGFTRNTKCSNHLVPCFE